MRIGSAVTAHATPPNHKQPRFGVPPHPPVKKQHPQCLSPSKQQRCAQGQHCRDAAFTPVCPRLAQVQFDASDHHKYLHRPPCAAIGRRNIRKTSVVCVVRYRVRCNFFVMLMGQAYFNTLELETNRFSVWCVQWPCVLGRWLNHALLAHGRARGVENQGRNSLRDLLHRVDWALSAFRPPCGPSHT